MEYLLILSISRSIHKSKEKAIPNTWDVFSPFSWRRPILSSLFPSFSCSLSLTHTQTPHPTPYTLHPRKPNCPQLKTHSFTDPSRNCRHGIGSQNVTHALLSSPTTQEWNLKLTERVLYSSHLLGDSSFFM